MLLTCCENLKSRAPVEFYYVDYCTLNYGIFNNKYFLHKKKTTENSIFWIKW